MPHHGHNSDNLLIEVIRIKNRELKCAECVTNACMYRYDTHSHRHITDLGLQETKQNVQNGEQPWIFTVRSPQRKQ